MAILPITKDDVTFSTTLVNPTRNYFSSSNGATGSLNIFPRASRIEKEVRPLSNFESSINDEDLETFRRSIISISKTKNVFFDQLDLFLKKINDQPASAKKQKKLDIIRFTPSTKFTSNTIRKLNVKNTLMHFYKTLYPSAQWGYTNYNSLNFFNSEAVPSSSVLLYPSIENQEIPVHEGYVSGTYSLSGGFSFDFRINPRYKSDGQNVENSFKAGTIFHLSSSYALSLITGSAKDENGLPSCFRLMLQLSHSADIPPSQAIPGNYPNDLIFLSDDNSLNWNNWHRVVVRWGTNLVNDGSGSFNIDGLDKGAFFIPSGTIMPKCYTSTLNDPKVLCIGNFYEGSNSGFSSQEYFFNDITSTRDGVHQFVDTSGTREEPDLYSFNHPLNAELHEICIHRNYLSDKQILSTLNASNLTKIEKNKIAFYVPPFFIEKTRIRRSFNGTGGIMQTPFFEINGSTDDPFNVAMAFGVNGHYINLENFVKDFANDSFPRLYHLSGTIIDYTTEAKEANEFLYDNFAIRKRNLTILPCDDGSFSPNYSVLSDQVFNKLVDSFGRKDPSIISLDNLLNTSSLLLGQQYDSNNDSTLIDLQTGFTVDNPGLPPGPAVINQKNKIENSISISEEEYTPGVQKNVPLSVYQRTKDSSSNQVTFFDISNLYYGSRILPGSFQISDNNLSGSGGKISITLKDDGFGNIYRSDCKSISCAWNSVGNIFYNEGIVLIKSPHLYFFGKEQYEISFKGEHQLHTSKYEVLAPRGLLNSSSNPTYARVETAISASADQLDTSKFVYISNINFHDENLNVVAKAVLAQPIIKREEEKILFKVAFDW